MKTKIIAEIGINHNGDLDKAKRLIDLAKTADSDYVKFQLYKTDNLVTKTGPLARYQKLTSNSNSQYDLLKKNELNFNQIKYLKNYCDKKKIKFLCSPFDNESASFLVNELNQNLIKIPSGEINNFPMLKILIRKKRNNLIISTGMSNLREITKTMKFLKKNKFDIIKNVILLHCVSSYPTNIYDMNLNYINTLRKKFSTKVGLSDHTSNSSLVKFAVALECEFVEKHITLSNKMKGPDHKSSLNPKNFKNFVSKIKSSHLIMGKSKKSMKRDELNNKKIAMKSLYAKTNIKINEIFTVKNIILKRPIHSKAVTPDDYFKILGKKSKKNYLVDSPIIL